ncbi:hypothetical protein B566_EDAN004628 [Ephemera danica]|nr:hypothetical protein B566_EDAN004628 [Ephemera danica]
MKFYYSCIVKNDSLQRTTHYCDENLYFDETSNSCIPFNSSECNFEHFIQIGNESITTSNAAKNGYTCTDNETLTYLNDCGVFKECVNGTWMEQDCNPKYYDLNSKSCVDDVSVCGRRGFCQLGQHLMDESDCSNFALCVESGTWEQRSCNGFYYDEMQGECVNDTNVCGNRTVTKRVSSPAQSPCAIEQRKEINSDCNKYEKCIFPGIWDVKTCTSNLSYDSNTASCVNDPKVCRSRQDQKYKCVVDQYELDPFHCHRYQKCDSSGNWVKLSCFNQYFDRKTNSCISNSSVCTEKLEHLDENIPNIKTIKNSESDSLVLRFDLVSNDSCTIGSFAVDTNDCRVYMQCVPPRGEWQIWSCGDFFYDPQTNACVCDPKVCGYRKYLRSTAAIDCFLTKYDLLTLGNATEIQ